MAHITGPFGLWRFPLLNYIFTLGRKIRMRSAGMTHRRSRTLRTVAENEECWELVRDENGRIVEVIVHRRVEKT